MVLEETRVIKDFLQSSMFSGPGPRSPRGWARSFCCLPPPPVTPNKLPELSLLRSSFQCSPRSAPSPEADPIMEGYQLMGEWGWEQG